jgi:hypothetical protein
MFPYHPLHIKCLRDSPEEKESILKRDVTSTNSVETKKGKLKKAKADYQRNSNEDNSAGADIPNFQNLHVDKGNIITRISNNTSIYLSGSCYATLLRGCAVLNGYAVRLGNSCSVPFILLQMS